MRWVGALIGITCVAGCGSRASPPPAAGTEIAVLAASSLREPVVRLAAHLEANDPNLKIRVSYAGSQELLAQILAGAPADVFLCAGTKHLTAALEKGVLDGVGRPFALNKLAIAFRKDLDPPLQEISDLARKGLRVIVAAEDVPVGRETRKFLAALEKKSPGLPARIWENVQSFEASDMAQIAKIRLGEADAAVVYVSDLKTNAELGKLQIPSDLNSIQIYFAAPLRASTSLPMARRFVKALLSGQGQSALESAGFQVAPPS